MTRAPALDEQETTFTIEATDRTTIHVFTNDSVWIARIEKLGIVAHDQDEYGKFYRVSLSDFNFGIRKKKALTNEQRRAIAERLNAPRDSSSDEDDEDD